jgi:predicted nucleic acid-binding protein
LIVFDSNIYASIIVRDRFCNKCQGLVRKHVSTGIATVDLAYVETASALWKSIAILDRIPADEAKLRVEALKRLLHVTSTIHASEEILEPSIRVAIQNRITVYDALYIALAETLNAKLATTDEELCQKLKDTPLRDITLLVR